MSNDVVLFLEMEACEVSDDNITTKRLGDTMIEDESAPYDMSIHSNSSPLAWATFFREHNPECNLDDNVMLGWFANAMMAMHDHIYQSTQPEQTEQITFKDDADKITHLENSVELLAGLLDAKKREPLRPLQLLKLMNKYELRIDLMRAVEKYHGIIGVDYEH